jgi:hypothetical protein
MTNLFKIAMTAAAVYMLYGGMIILILVDSVYANRVLRSPSRNYHWGRVSLPVCRQSDSIV